MTSKSVFHIPFISKTLMDFFDKHDNIIYEIFNILKTIKCDIPNAYYYSAENPPPHPKYKYTDKLYIGCIFYVLKNNSSWNSFIGPIPGKQLNKRHLEYIKYDLYSTFYEKTLKHYSENMQIKYLSLDATIINNKQCTEVSKHLPCNKNRKGLKISTIVDNIGSPLNYAIKESTVHDSKVAIENINDLKNNGNIKEAIDKINGYLYILADSGYDTKDIREMIKQLNYRSIIKPNNRNTKDRKKMRRLNKSEKKKYKKRLKVEHFFGIIKKYPKINCIYEKTISSYIGLLLLLFGSILLNRIKT